MSIMFNEICINEEMLPKYTYFKLHDPAAHKYSSISECRRDLVKRQITLCKNNINGKDALTFAFARPCEEIHRSTSLMNSSLRL